MCVFFSNRDKPVGLKKNNSNITSLCYFRQLFCLKNLTDQSWNCAMPSDVSFEDCLLFSGLLFFSFYFFFLVRSCTATHQTLLSIVRSDPVVEVMRIWRSMIWTEKNWAVSLSAKGQNHSVGHEHYPASSVFYHKLKWFTCPNSLIWLTVIFL